MADRISMYAYFEQDALENQMMEKNIYMEVEDIRIYPKKIIMTNAFEGKVFQETIVIRNCGKKPVLIRILKPNSSGIRIKKIVHGSFLCSGMSIRRTVTYKVQMMTLINSCVIPIYINDLVIDYPVCLLMTQVNLIIEPDTFIDFGKIDIGPTPSKRTLKIVNSDVKPAKFFIDLGPNELELVVVPPRGIVMGEDKVEIEISLNQSEEGEYATEFWIISENPICINVNAVFGYPRMEPLYTFKMKSFTFVQFPITYYGTTSMRSVIVHNNSQSQTFFCVMGEIELETFTLKEVKKMVPDYNYFKITPEEGRLLPDDIRVFQISYTPNAANLVIKKRDYNLVMMRIKRLICKDLNAKNYSEGVYDELVTTSTIFDETRRVSADVAFTEECNKPVDDQEQAQPDGSMSVGMLAGNEIRLMLYAQVEQVSVTVIPDSLTLTNLMVDQVEKRVLQLQNNSTTLPIIFHYKKIAFVEIEPKVGILQPSESIEVAVIVKPKSFAIINTDIIFDLLYYNEPRKKNDLTVVGSIKIAFAMTEKIVSKKPKSSTETRLAKNFDFRKPNIKPNEFVMNILKKGKTYIGLPDDRPSNNMADPKMRMFKSIYATLPRYQPTFNKYALTENDKKLLKKKTYYNMYIGMHAKNKDNKSLIEIPEQKCIKFKQHKKKIRHDDEDFSTHEFIPLTPIQLALIDLSPRGFVLENVAFNSTFLHKICINNKNNSFLKIFLKPRTHGEFNFIKGSRHTIPAKSERDISFLINIDATPLHNYELDVIINNCYVVETSVLVKARPIQLKLSVELLTFYENEPPNKFIELHNELNVDIQFQWRVPSVFKVDPVEGEVVSGRFVACMITFEIGVAENMVYNLGIHTENKFYNLSVLIEGTDYKVKMPKLLTFGEMSLNVPCCKSLPLCNLSRQFLSFEIDDELLPEGVNIKPRIGRIMPLGIVNLTVCANRGIFGDFFGKVEVCIVHRQKITCELSGTVVFPQIHFRPETLRFRKMAASSFDIACVTLINTSNAVATLSFDTERFPEFNYSEYTNSEYLTNKDVLYVNENEEKQFSIHFYPFNPLVTSFPLPININNVGVANKSRTMLLWKPSLKVHAQVLSFKLEVKSWRYKFTYFPYFDYKNVTSQEILIKNPCKVPLTFCIRLDELAEPFDFEYKMGGKVMRYDCSFVVDLQPDDYVVFEATFTPTTPGSHTIRLPVYVKDDFSQDMHNYFYFNGEYPAATYSNNEKAVYLGFIPLRFTISKRIVVEMAYHHPSCTCVAFMNDCHCYVETDSVKPKKTINHKIVQIIFSCTRPHLLSAKIELSCDCPGPNIEIEVYGGSDNNYFTVHACIQYLTCTTNMSFNALFEPNDGDNTMNVSTITIQDPEREEGLKHNFITDLPYFPSGNNPFDLYMYEVVEIFEKWLLEEVFFGTRSFSIPETICLPDIKLFDKQGKREGIIKMPLQMILYHLVGASLMSQYEIKYSEKKPIWMIIRKFYTSILYFLLSINCFVNQIKPEFLLPYDYYQDYMLAMEPKREKLSVNNFHLIAKQCWLDLLMQSYKSLVHRRILQNLSTSLMNTKISAVASKLSASTCAPPKLMYRYPGISIEAGTIFSEEGVMLLAWMDKHFQEQKYKLASAKYGNKITDEFMAKHIENFNEDLSDSLAIVSILLTHCSFLGDFIMGIYAPATNRMEKFNNAYIVIKILNLLQVSFHLEPLDIIEPNTVRMLLLLTYLYDFLIPIKSKETIYFTAELSKTRQESITIHNENKHKLYYSIVFFNNNDDLFSVEESTIIVEPNSPFKLLITYCARFLRVQKTVLLLSGEIPGYQYTNSKIYYLQGIPDIITAGDLLGARSIIYKISPIKFEFKSPYPIAAEYNMFIANEYSTDVNQLLESLIPYSSVLETKTLTRVKLQSAIAQADDTGNIKLSAHLCSIINTKKNYWLVLRNDVIGDFIIKLDISTKPMKKRTIISLTMQKSLIMFPCTCPKKQPNVYNNKCPRNVKVMIPCRNEYLWNSVMEFFLSGRDPEENDFWEIYKKTPIGSHIVKRILYDHKKFLSKDMDYFMDQSFTYNVSVKDSSIVTQSTKTVKLALVDTTTDILMHFNEAVNSFTLTLQSVDDKETRVYKVRVLYE